MYPSKKDIKSMNRIIDVIFYRIFHTYDSDLIYVLRDFCGLCDVDTLLNARRMNFTARFFHKKFSFSDMILGVNRKSRVTG